MLEEVQVIEIETFIDARGTFSNVFDLNTKLGLEISTKKMSLSHATNLSKGTLRGLHFQEAPYEQAKLVWCSAGSAFDVIVDIRPESVNFGTWNSFDLTSSQSIALYIPAGFAHGYQTLEDNTTITYLLAGESNNDFARSLLWKDDFLKITWPENVSVISEKDRSARTWQSLF